MCTSQVTEKLFAQTGISQDRPPAVAELPKQAMNKASGVMLVRYHAGA